MLLIMLMTNRRIVMGDKTNSLLLNLLGWTTTAIMFAATLALIWSWVAG
jgi:Mn2+/Fe2+ NRAMP family transporter